MPLVTQVSRALEHSSRPVLPIQRYEREDHSPARQSDDVRLTPMERHASATSILRRVDRLPAHEQAAVYGLAGDRAMREGAVLVLLDLVDRDYLGDGPAKEAIRWWLGGRSQSVRALARDYGGGKTMHHDYRHRVAAILDGVLRRANWMVCSVN